MAILKTIDDAENLPVSVEEARTQCHLFDDTTHDALLTRYIRAAAVEAENYTRSVLVERTQELVLEGFPGGAIDIPVYPLQSVTSIIYDTSTANDVTLATNKYRVQPEGMEPAIIAIGGWPSTKQDASNTVRIRITTGYATISDIPEPIRQAILMRVYEMYENPGSVAAITQEHNSVYASMLNTQRRY